MQLVMLVQEVPSELPCSATPTVAARLAAFALSPRLPLGKRAPPLTPSLTLVRITTGIKLRDPQRSEGLVSLNVLVGPHDISPSSSPEASLDDVAK
jgi:hypothetical protein